VTLTKRRILTARIIAVVADALQLGLFPLFGEGWLSPFNDILDGVVAALMIALVGWHWSFLPAFIAELVPGFDAVPSWTVAVLVATRHPASDADPAAAPASRPAAARDLSPPPSR